MNKMCENQQPTLEILRQVFQSMPQPSDEALPVSLSMLFSFMLQHSNTQKVLKKEVETQTEATLLNVKRKRHRRRRKRNVKDTNDNKTPQVTTKCEATCVANINVIPQPPDSDETGEEGKRTEGPSCQLNSQTPTQETDSSSKEQLNFNWFQSSGNKKYRKRYEYSRSSSSSSSSSSSRSRSRSRTRSPSIRRRRASPSFLSSRRITSARRLPVSYCRRSPCKDRGRSRSCRTSPGRERKGSKSRRRSRRSSSCRSDSESDGITKESNRQKRF